MNLGVIGCGKMGGALLQGIVKAGVFSGNRVTVYDSYVPAAQQAAAATGAAIAPGNAELAEKSDVILLCVKPQGMVETLREMGPCQDKLIISIAAGIRIRTIEEILPPGNRVIRVMPNTPSLVGLGAAAYSRGASATAADAELTRKLLESVGCACEVAETDLDAVTALSGSGPAYVFLLVEALVAAAVAQGLEEKMALQLAAQTVAGAAEMIKKTGESPAKLRENVTSPKGTTHAALESFRADGFEAMVKRALDAARQRSIELASGK